MTPTVTHLRGPLASWRSHARVAHRWRGRAPRGPDPATAAPPPSSPLDEQTNEPPNDRARRARARAPRGNIRYAFELEDDTDDNPLDEDEDVIFTCRGVDGARVVVDEGSLELVTRRYIPLHTVPRVTGSLELVTD